MRIAMISEHASPLVAFCNDRPAASTGRSSASRGHQADAQPWLSSALGGDDAGGQNIHVAELSAALARQGHDVRVYTRRDSPEAPEAVPTPGGFTVVHVPAGPAQPLPKDTLLPYMEGFGRWLADTWQAGAWEPDVVHAHFWMSGIAAMVARDRVGVPVVLTYHALGTVKRRHQGTADTSPPDRIGYERDLGRTVDRVIAQSRDEQHELNRMGVRRDRVALAPSGVDSDRFSPTGPVAPRHEGHRRILTVGRLVERKGYADVVAALQLVPEAECVLVGGPAADQLDDHPVALRLRQRAQECGVEDRLRLVGTVPPEEMPEWYRSADVLVAAPWYEPFGLVPLEAMACGVPVVATAVGGLTDTVVHGVTGQLVPARNPRALGLALRRLLRDEPRRYAYAVAALDRARQRYSWQRAADQICAAYGSVCRQRTEVVA